MPAAPRHEMVHQGTDAAGMEEWRCPLCGRHFLVRWPPDYQRLVLAEGDEQAVHVGRKGPVGLGGIEVPAAAADPGPDPRAPGPDDRAWRRWLSDHGLDWDDPDV
jgi:hypothetical protein